MELTKELIQRSKSWTMMTDVKDVLYSACDLLEHFLQIDAGYFLYYRQETDIGMEYSWGLNTPEHVLNAATYASDHFLPQLQSIQGYWMTIDEAPLPWREIMHREGLARGAGWLITINENVVGVFVLGHRTTDLADSDIISLSMAHICLMVEMIVYRRTAEQVSLRDPLTGLLNRRGLTLELERVLAERRPSHAYMLAVIDVNDLKKVNDARGHLEGDALLIQVAHLMQINLHQYHGICARFGGDEFVMVLHLATDDTSTCECTIASWFEEHEINVSVGCAVFGPDYHRFDRCFQVADERMYERKSGLIT